MASVYTSNDYASVITEMRFCLDHGSHVGSGTLAKALAMLEDASANIAGITPIAPIPQVDGGGSSVDPVGAGDG